MLHDNQENLQPLPDEVKEKRFDSFDDIPSDPKAEGLRPGRRYAGGAPDEIIIVAGKRYKKEISCRAYDETASGVVILDRPYTEREFFSHDTEGVGFGPGWDIRWSYLKDGWGIHDGDPNHLSDLPFYELIQIEE